MSRNNDTTDPADQHDVKQTLENLNILLIREPKHTITVQHKGNKQNIADPADQSVVK